MNKVIEQNEKYNLLSIRDEVHYLHENEWPRHLEGSLLESAVVEAINDFQVAREMAITSALGAIAVACQGLVDIEQPTGNKVTSSLMLLTIAESGERKTTVEKYFFKEIRQQQKFALEEYKNLYSEYEYKLSLYKDIESALRKKIKILVANNENTETIEQQLIDLKNAQQPQPLAKKFIYDDSTPQALVQGMNEGCKNACLVSSEANGIFNGKVFSELHLINTLWDGGDVTVDRVTKQSFILNNARLTLALMTQMSVIEHFLETRGAEARGMGFLARFLVVRPPSKAGYRDAQRNLTELKHLSNFNKRIGEILTTSLKNEDNNSPKITIKFNASSASLWREYSQAIENEMRINGVYEHYRDHASKLMDNITRVAGIVEFYEGKNNEITVETLNFSYGLCMRYSKHFLKYLAGEPAVVINANLLAQCLLKKCDKPNTNQMDVVDITPFSYNGIQIRNGNSTEFTRSYVLQFGSNVLRNSKNDYAALTNAMELLRRMGYVEKITNRSGELYKFCESTIFSSMVGTGHQLEEPMLKNGNEYTIESLPLFDDLIPYHPIEDSNMMSSNRYSRINYYIKVS